MWNCSEFFRLDSLKLGLAVYVTRVLGTALGQPECGRFAPPNLSCSFSPTSSSVSFKSLLYLTRGKTLFLTVITLALGSFCLHSYISWGSSLPACDISVSLTSGFRLLASGFRLLEADPPMDFLCGPGPASLTILVLPPHLLPSCQEFSFCAVADLVWFGGKSTEVESCL